MKKVPHAIPYQGSKRKLADKILSYINFDFDTLYEPFVGSGAITIAAAASKKANKFVISDKLEPLTKLWDLIVNNPEKLTNEYSTLWNEQLSDPANYYKKIRSEFNVNKSPSHLLYLVARCVKNAIRFNSDGEFNQSPDNRRLGLKPDKLEKEVSIISELLKDKIDIISGDFRDSIANATPNDLIYMDPPWQGTSGKNNPRYAYLLDLDELIQELSNLNKRNIPYMLSFDGTCGDRTYGAGLPNYLNLRKVDLHAGRSSQATLLGRNDITIESLYLSPALLEKNNVNKNGLQLDLLEASFS